MRDVVRTFLVLLVLAGLGWASPLSQEKEDATLWVEVVSAHTGEPLVEQRLALTRGKRSSFNGEYVGAMDGALGKFPATDDAGRARFRVPPGAYRVVARFEERSRARREFPVATLAAGEVRTLRVELPTEYDVRFRCRLVDGLNGRPLAGAEVLLFDGNSWGTSWPIYLESKVQAELAWTVTDDEGRFEVIAPSWRHAMVRLRAPGYAPAFTSVVPGHAELGNEVVLRVGRSAELEVTVVQGGHVVPGIRVDLSEEDGGWIRSGTTEAAGHCRLSNVPAGVKLRARLYRPDPEDWPEPGPWGYPSFPSQRSYDPIPETLVFSPDEARRVTWELYSTCIVRGVARDQDGRPGRGLVLQLIRDNGEREEPFRIPMTQSPDLVDCDDEGGFVIEALPPGVWWLGPYGGNFRDGSRQEAAPFATPFTISSGRTDLDLELGVHVGLFVSGRVVDGTGRPVVGARVRCRRPWLKTRTRAEGEFRFGPLIPGEYELTATASGHAESLTVRVPAGGQPTELRLRQAGTIRVRTVGDLSPTAEVWLYRDAPPRGVGPFSIGDRGLYRENLLPGVYSIVGRDGDRIGARRNIEVKAGEEVIVTLPIAEPAATLDVRHTDPDLEYSYLFVVQEDSTLGWSVFDGKKARQLTVPAGKCQLVLEEPERAWTQTMFVEAVAGVVTEVVFPRR